MSTRAKDLLDLYDNLDWNAYVFLIENMVSVDKNNLEDELVRQATSYASYSGLLARSKTDFDLATAKLNNFSATVRQKAKYEIGPKKTAKDLDDLVIAHPDYATYESDVRAANEKFNLLKGLVNALIQKRDSLVQLSSNQRAETKLYN